MRGIGSALILLAAAGCAGPKQVQFQHSSEIDARFTGLAMYDDGSSAQAGMVGNTCEIYTQDATIGNDVDVAYGQPDHVTDAFGTTGMVIGNQGIYVLDDTQFWTSDPTVALSDVVDARFTAAGSVDVRNTSADGCVVDWNNGGSTSSVTIGGSDACGSGSSLAVDRQTGTVFVAGASGLSIATADGSTAIESDADLVAWDSSADALYVASTGGTKVTALEADGTTRWTADTDQPIQAISSMGAIGNAAVMTGDSQAGLLRVLDGQTGGIVTDLPTPSAASRVSVSANGNVMAFQLERATHFFQVSLNN